MHMLQFIIAIANCHLMLFELLLYSFWCNYSIEISLFNNTIISLCCSPNIFFENSFINLNSNGSDFLKIHQKCFAFIHLFYSHMLKNSLLKCFCLFSVQINNIVYLRVIVNRKYFYHDKIIQNELTIYLYVYKKI